MWSGTDSGKKSLVAWKTVCQEYDRGGLQIKGVLSWNDSVIGYLVVQLANPNRKDTVLTNWIQHNKLAHVDFMQVTCKQADSSWWKVILHMRDLLLSKMPDFQVQLVGLPGKLVTHRIYDCLVPKAAVVPWYNQVWRSFSSLRTSFLYWIIVLRRLPTKDRLVRFDILSDSTCSLCGTVTESHDHIFCQCSFTSFILDKIMTVVGVRFRGQFQFFSVGGCKTPMVLKLRNAGFCCVLDTIWLTRNNVCFREGPVNVELASKQAATNFLALINKHCKSPQNRFIIGVLSKLQRFELDKI